MSFKNLHNYANYAICDVTCFHISHNFLSHMKENFMLFINIYGFVRFLCNVSTLKALFLSHRSCIPVK